MKNKYFDITTKVNLYAYLAIIVISLVFFGYAIDSILEGVAARASVEADKQSIVFWFMVVANICGGAAMGWLGIIGIIKRRKILSASNSPSVEDIIRDEIGSGVFSVPAYGKTSLLRVVLADNMTFLASGFLTGVIVLAVFIVRDIDDLVFIFSVVSMLSFVVYFRWKYISDIVNNSREYKGIITNYSPSSGAIWFSYIVDNQVFNKYYIAMFYVGNLNVGDVITVLVDVNRNHRAVIKDLFVQQEI